MHSMIARSGAQRDGYDRMLWENLVTIPTFDAMLAIAAPATTKTQCQHARHARTCSIFYRPLSLILGFQTDNVRVIVHPSHPQQGKCPKDFRVIKLVDLS